MKRKLEEESINLIGRTAAERSLDRIYNRQKAELKKLKPKEDEDKSLLTFNKVLPFPEVSKTDPSLKPDADSGPKVKSEPVKRTLKEVLSDLSNKHIPNKAKFAKSVTLLSKLSLSFFKDSYKTETEVTYLDFFSVFNTVNNVFVKEYSGNVPKECFDEKSALVSLTQVVDYLLDLNPEKVKTEKSEVKRESDSDHSDTNPELRFTPEEKQFLTLLKVSFGYPSSIWYENDPFVFHSVVNSLKKHFEDVVDQTSKGFQLRDIVKVKDDPFEMPSMDELLTLQLKSFVRTLAVVFSFFDLTWSKSSLVPLFSLVYLKRHIFEEADQVRISGWQAHINANRTKGSRSKLKSKIISSAVVVQGIGESAFQVQDGRDEKVTSVHGSQKWSDRHIGL